MRIIRLRAAKLVVWNCRPGTGGNRTTGQILQLTASSHISDEDVELAVETERDHTPIVVAARWLRLITLARRLGRSIVLVGAQFDQVDVKRKRYAIPNKTIHAVAKQGHSKHVITIRAKFWSVSAFLLRRHKRIV
jgi:hypothetical protein